MLRSGIFAFITIMCLALVWNSPRPASIARPSLTRVNYVAPQKDNAKTDDGKEEFTALKSAFDAAITELRQKVAAIESEDGQAQYLVNNNPAIDFSAKFIELAKKYPGTKTAVNSLLFAYGQSRDEQKNAAMTMLLENYSTKVRADKIAASFKEEVPSPEIEKWFQLMIKGVTKDSIKASVIYDYSKYVAQIPIFRRTLELNPAVAKRLSAAQLDYINTDRTEEQDTRLAELLQTVIYEHGDLKKGRSTFGQLAKQELYDLQYLQVGHVAPDIEGKDLDGIPFRLSDYRGKVVMLDFWGQWCPPCRAMYNHEREILRALADKPFVLLGVNSDEEFDTVKEAVRDEGLSWRHFWNGPKGTNGPIAKQWNVEGWPTFYLIDENGIIRYKEVLGRDIDLGLEKLMSEMGHEVSLTNDATN